MIQAVASAIVAHSTATFVESIPMQQNAAGATLLAHYGIVMKSCMGKSVVKDAIAY